VLHLNSFVSSYINNNDHFNSERSKSVQSTKKAVANARDLMDDAARVRSLKYEVAFDSSSNELGWQCWQMCLSATPLKRQTFLSVADMSEMLSRHAGKFCYVGQFFGCRRHVGEPVANTHS
jgi:hypothetical protein